MNFTDKIACVHWCEPF